MKHLLQILNVLLVLVGFSCENQECESTREVSTFSKDYIEVSDSTDFQGQKTLVFEETNTQMGFNHGFCTGSSGSGNCISDVQIKNLTDRKVRVYIYRSTDSRDNKQGARLVLDCPPNGISSRSNLYFISGTGCISLENLFPLLRVSYL